MIFPKQIALKLEALIPEYVEEALILMLNDVLRQSEEEIEYNPNATDIELRQLQGKKLLVKELKQYRQRILDAVTNGGTSFST